MAAITRAAVNNAILDPLQGFDFDVYVQDQATGAQLLVGNFTSFQWTMRNATEPYMEFNQRVPRLLDGEFQFGWVLERGCIDIRFVQQTFGVNAIGRELRISRSPRFQITIEANAPELEGNGFTGGAIELANTNGYTSANRKAKGRYRLVYAKVDAFTFGAMAGRSVVANRWEGLCEGIYFNEDGLIGNPGANGGVGANPGSFFSDVVQGTPNSPVSDSIPSWATLPTPA